MSSTHAYFAFYRHMGLFNQWKGVKIVCFHAGAFKSKKTSCKRAFLQEDASFYFNFQSFSCQVQLKVFLTLVSDVFLN